MSRAHCSPPAPSPLVRLSIAVVTFLWCITSLVQLRSERKDWQIQRNQNRCDGNAHEYQNDRLDELQCRRQGKLHVFFVKLCHGVEHGWQGSRGFSHFAHLDSQIGKTLPFLQPQGKQPAFTHTLPSSSHL